jgi:hypothetical protein
MNSQERPHMIRAQLHALLGAGPTLARLDALHLEALRTLGPAHEVTLTVEYHLNHHRDLALAAGDPVAIATDLWDRVRVALPADHPTHRAITSHLVRCFNRRGRSGDLDRAVALRRDQVRRHAHSPGADGAGTAQLHLGAALLERGRFGWLDPDIASRGPNNDLLAARELIESELDRRLDTHGPDHLYTWRAQALRCQLLVALAQDTGGLWTAEALTLAEDIMRYEWEQARCHTVGALHAQLWRAEALLLLDRDREAEAEARLASVLAYRYPGPEVANALLVLARTLAGRNRHAARAAADLAVKTRLVWSATDGYPVVEAQLLVDRLRRVDGHIVKAAGATVPSARRCRTSARSR